MQGFARGSFFGAVLEGEMRTRLGLIGLAAASSAVREATLGTGSTEPLAAEVTGGVSLWFGTTQFWSETFDWLAERPESRRLPTRCATSFFN
jgi:hypothetical protein